MSTKLDRLLKEFKCLSAIMLSTHKTHYHPSAVLVHTPHKQCGRAAYSMPHSLKKKMQRLPLYGQLSH